LSPVRENVFIVMVMILVKASGTARGRAGSKQVTGQVGPTVILFVTDGKELVARTERLGFSARLVNEFPSWICIGLFR
jgi:hypothetical protein